MKGKRNLIHALDDLHSLWIRLEESDDHGYCICFTCGRPFHYKEIDCGHFRSRSDSRTRWIRENTHAQCSDCNRYKQGNLDAYEDRLCEVYGPDILEVLQEVDHSPFLPTKEWLESEIEYRKERIVQLLSEKMTS